MPQILRVLLIAILDSLGLDNSVPRNHALISSVLAAAKLLETAELEARLEAVEAALGPACPGRWKGDGEMDKTIRPAQAREGGDMSIDVRLNKLMPVLSGKERAILVLESWKAREQEDPRWRSTMPTDQARHFNRLIELMNGSVLQMGQYITVLEQQQDKLELRQCWLVALVLWDEQLTEITRAAQIALRGPITDSEYAAKRPIWIRNGGPSPSLPVSSPTTTAPRLRRTTKGSKAGTSP